MRFPLTSISAGAFTLMTLSTLGLAQGVALPPNAAPAATTYDPRQFPAIRGEIDRFTLGARGEIDGFVLTDGTEVKTAPNLSRQVAFAMKPGDRITVRGLKAAALPLVSAVSITDETTARTVTDAGISAGPPTNPPPAAPPRPPGVVGETTGRVRMSLHGPQGELNGVLLESGTILRFPPDQNAQLTKLIQPRQTVVAEGITITNTLGTVVDVRRIGPSHDTLVPVAPGPGLPPPPAQTTS